MRIQSNLGSDICMAFDECVENPAPREYVKQSVDRTFRWLERCKAENARLNSLPDTVNKEQMLWGINQGGTYADIRVDHMKRIAELDLPGYAIGGLAVGETAEEMYDIIEAVEPYMPSEKTRYLMGVWKDSQCLQLPYQEERIFYWQLYISLRDVCWLSFMILLTTDATRQQRSFHR